MKKIVIQHPLFSFVSSSPKMKLNFSFAAGLLLLLLPGMVNGQQVIGNFPTMDGGFEGQSVTGLTLPVGAANNLTAGATVATYSRNTNNPQPVTCAFIRATGGNSSPKCFSWTNSSSSAEIFTPTASSNAVQLNTSYVVQFFAKKDSSDRTRSFTIRVSTNGTNFSSTANTAQSATLSYQKFTAIVTTPSGGITGTGYIGIKPNGGGFYNSGSPIIPCNYLVDDICMYAGSAVDNQAPDEVISPSATSAGTTLNLTWSAPTTNGGVDGGGYVVIRYTSNPVAEPAPIANGIYAVGNTVGNGTIVSIGTATNFSNTGLTANTSYYYRIYVVDKAFNYSPTPVTVAGYTGTAVPTAISFTTPASCITDRITISWTGPLNYSVANNTQLAFLKQGSAVTVGTPTLAPTAYTENTVFGSGTAYQNDAAAYCIYNGDGTDASGNHSGLTITGLSPNTTYYLLIYNVIDAGPTYSAATTGNGTTLNNLAEPANSPTALAKGAVTTSNIPLAWAAAGGSPAPTGYLVKASNTAAPADPVDLTDPADQLSIAGGTANGKTAGTSYSSFTGFSAGTMYYFRASSYTNSGTCIDFKAAGPTINVATLPNAVTSQSLSITGGLGTINWTTATGYINANHTTLVFVSSSAITVGTPTVNPGGYTANTVFNSGTPFQLDANAKCVYNGDGSSATVSGLISGNTYYMLILTVVSAANSDGSCSYSAYATSSTTYSSAFEYTWKNSVAAGSWQTATNWVPDRNTPSQNDVLIFNGPATVTATDVPSETIAKLSINSGNVTLQSNATATLVVRNTDVIANINDLVVAAGTSVTLGNTNVLNMRLGQSTLAYIAGIVNVNNGNLYHTDSTNAVTTLAGTINNYGTVTSTTAAKFVVNNEGTYNHGVEGGTIPTGTWNYNSTCLITGIDSVQNFNGHGQTYSKFIWDCPNQGQTNGKTHFVLGENINKVSGPYVVITDSFIVRRTNGKILQLTSSGGQNDFTCGNYFQYGGIVAITYNTDAGGLQRSLTVNNTFYVTDSVVPNTKFQVINNPGGTNDINGRLYVKGNFEMHVTNTAAALDATKGVSNPSVAELWFTGSSAQYARFSTITGNVDFVTNHTGTGVTLGTDVTANKFKLVKGTFFINGNTLTIKDSVTYPSPGAGTIGGSSTSNLTLNGIAGSLSFYNGYRVLKNFTLTANATTSLGTELGITAGLTPGKVSLATGAVLTANDNLILRSDANGTARIDQVPVNGSGVALATINDKVTVERYLPMNLTYDSRRWRLLTAPFKTNNSPTINAAWQEGAVCPDRFDPAPYDPKPGYGTHITVNTTAANGFDQGVRSNPSILKYNNGTGTWTAPANTNSVKITDNYGAYMLFVRGDRSIIIIDQFVNAKPTTLDPKGELNLGNVTVPVAASGMQPVGNPYASAIKLDNVSFNDTLGNRKWVYLWDPKALGASNNVGKFITCQGDGNSPASYTYTGNSSNYSSAPGVIESSGAFMVWANGGNIVFHETDKIATSTTIGMASRPGSAKTTGDFGTIAKLYTDLETIKNGEPALCDGVVSVFNKNYSNSIDDMDALKPFSFSTNEMLYIKRNDQKFGIERRKKLSTTDTIFLNLYKPLIRNYRFSFRPTDFDDRYAASLKDNFTNTLTPVDMQKNSAYNFSITSDPASYMPGRFYIIFSRKIPAAPITAAAEEVEHDINVEWNNPDFEYDVPYYIERAANAGQFVTIAVKTVADIQENKFNWLDTKVEPGNYSYRIRYADEEGNTKYSNLVNVLKHGFKGAPFVYPNPVVNRRIGLQMGSLPKGIYTIKLYNTAGQLMQQQVAVHAGNTETKIIAVKNAIAKGTYKLEIVTANKTAATINVLIQ